MYSFVALEHQIYQFYAPKILQVSHKPLERFKQLSTCAKESDAIRIVPIRHVTGKGEFKPTNVGANACHGRVVQALLLGVPRYHVHKLVEVVKVQHWLEYERTKVLANFVETRGRSYMIQNILPAAVIVEFPSCESGILQGERGPYIL